MKTTIEFYIPIDKLQHYLSGGVVLFSSSPANGLIKVVEAPENIVYVRKDLSIYYIRKSSSTERRKIKRGKKVS